MPFQVSPGVNVSEVDLTTVVPAFSSTEGAIAGPFRWGPIDQAILIDSEQSLVARFGKPTNHNAETFFTAANFLAYGNKLYVARTANTLSSDPTVASWNAVANVGPVTTRTDFVIKNREDYETKEASGTLTSDTDVIAIAKYPGALGNSLKISVCDSASQYEENIPLVVNTNIDSNTSFLQCNVGVSSAVLAVSNTSTGTLADANSVVASVMAKLSVGDLIRAGRADTGFQELKIVSITAQNTASSPCTSIDFAELVPIGNATHRFVTINFESKFSMAANVNPTTVTRLWEYHGIVDSAPGQSTHVANFGNTAANDEMHIIVVDQDGEFTGVPGTILEVYEGVSRATDAKLEDGTTNFVRTVINDNSQYIWLANARQNAPFATATGLISSVNTKPLTLSMQDGTDGPSEDTMGVLDILRGYAQFTSAEKIDISLVLGGKARGGANDTQISSWIIDNIADARKDCVAFISPPRSAVVRNPTGIPTIDIVNFRNNLRDSSYAVLDSGYKYQYDKYNDIYRYIPLNGDTAGLCVRTDEQRDPWFSPAGFNRGQVKNLIKLAFNPSKVERDILYKAGVNPVVTFPGQGTVLFGDKTLLSKPSAFDRINVRRLFIVLEKAISTAAKFTLFEFNDEFTRAQFRNLVEPFLRDVQGRRGIYEYRVVCDETNNPSSVIDRNEFVGDIYIKPARSINFIQLNFVAVRTGVEFSEIVGTV